MGSVRLLLDLVPFLCPGLPPHFQGINKGVDIFECVQSAVAIDRLLGINAFSLDKLLAEDPAFLVSNVLNKPACLEYGKPITRLNNKFII